MSNLTRKDFIRLSAWGFAASVLPIGQLNALSSLHKSDTSPSNDDFKKAQDLAKTAKVLFYQKKYKESEELYLQCIRLAPASIRFYDNLDNVYGAQKDLFSSIIMYKSGLLQNPTKIAFYDRAARSLMRLETGRKSLAAKYRTQISSLSLLKDARTLYQKALQLDPAKKYLTVGLTKIQYKIDTNAVELNYRTSDSNKAKLKMDQQLYRTIIMTKTDKEIEALINNVDTKKRPVLYDVKEIAQQKSQMIEQKKKYYRILFSRRTLEPAKSVLFAELLFNLDPSDPVSLKNLQSHYYTRKRYYDFIAPRQKFADTKQDVYAYLGLMDAYETAYKRNQLDLSLLNRAVIIGNDLWDNWPLLDLARVDVADKLARIYTLMSNFQAAKTVLEKTIVLTLTTSSAIVNKLIYSYARVLLKQGSVNDSRQVLLIGSGEPEGENTFTNIRTLARQKGVETIKEKITLYYLLYEVYAVLNDSANAKNVLAIIASNNSYDPFLLTRN